MALLDEIIEAATDDKASLGTLLRKCLILENQSPNSRFKAWLDKELDGYGEDDELPTYRVFIAGSYGIFVGMVQQLNNQPLPLHILTPEDRKLLDPMKLRQPAASYEGLDKTTDAQLPWPPVLTVKYQRKFYEGGDLILNRAWQLIPGSMLVALQEQVRTRVLRFALELKKELGSRSLDQLPRETVETSVEKHIFAGKLIDWT